MIHKIIISNNCIKLIYSDNINKDSSNKIVSNAIDDVALIEVFTPFEFGTELNIAPACLLSKEKEYSFKDELLFVAGFGATTENFIIDPPLENKKLYLTTVKQTDHFACDNKKELICFTPKFPELSTICVGGK